MPGTRECTGNTPRTCSQLGEWSSGASCDFVCDDGECAGSCVPEARRCVGQTRQVCDWQGAWGQTEPCQFVCSNGDCVGSCVPGEVHCKDAITLEACNQTGTWEFTACEFACTVVYPDGGECGGVCIPGSKSCDGKTPKECSGGVWAFGTPCTIACVNGGCADCEPGAKDCNGTEPMTCSALGHWTYGAPCPTGCVAGDCTGGVCTPGAKQCNGTIPQTCSSAGQWTNGTACAHLCTAGVCTGVCTPGEKGCSGNTPQTCNSAGNWTSGTGCSGQTPICSGGSCAAPPVGPMTLVNGPGFPAINYLIDSTEVTREQYEGWLLTNPSISAQSASCKPWNSTFTPDSSCMAGLSVCKGAACAKHPQVCIDWCDARAYCLSVGKHLCGRVGGGALLQSDMNDATKAQWYNACSSDGVYMYPYGNTYGAHMCNGHEHNVGTTLPAGSMASCQSSAGGFKSVFDMSGNVYEWEDACSASTGQYDTCGLRGGSYKMAAETSLACKNQVNTRNYYSEDVGFRCCQDL